MSLTLEEDYALRAEHMLDLWRELAMRHIALGAGCACGTGGVSLRLEDFELDIVDYLVDAGLRCGVTDVVEYFEAVQQTALSAQPLRILLEEAQQEHLPNSVSEWLLPRVERTLRSFAELHGASGRG